MPHPASPDPHDATRRAPGLPLAPTRARAAGRGQRSVLLAVRSAVTLHRLLDVLPVFDGDDRVRVRFTLVPGSRFDVDALTALDRTGARTIPWRDACHTRHDLVLTASPKGDLHLLPGPRALLPHGAGFGKALSGEGSADVPSGLDPVHLLADGEPWADLHALAHEEQALRLARHCPEAGPAVVVGDPTADRLLRSLPHREEYRTALGTGPRQLVVLTSTWGPESLIARRPRFPAELVALLPHDAFQVALVLHPNDHSRTGGFDLARWMGPALRAGLVLARPHEEWAALLVAADAVVTDHGSTGLYAAALGRPVVGAHDGGRELVPDSPMARLLARAPHLAAAHDLPTALDAARRTDLREPVAHAFAHQGRALTLLRGHLYRLLGLGGRPAPSPPPPSQRPPPHRSGPPSSPYAPRSPATASPCTASPRTPANRCTTWPPNTPRPAPARSRARPSCGSTHGPGPRPPTTRPGRPPAGRPPSWRRCPAAGPPQRSSPGGRFCCATATPDC
ncbi:translation initiation factor 2 [Streptomyces sp. S399]|uniref:translation initiation factor 2 n=1 Tax=Streptomyces sp. S399 TaxID=3096009 RepID=UPI002A829E3A|nr:translation initiation factor 2 [Streptomyces sp. S399]WPR52606.1 translation initiation factor 2 [Streptomyces sp. S399]